MYDSRASDCGYSPSRHRFTTVIIMSSGYIIQIADDLKNSY
jgi:hypothetical protein